MRRRSLPRAIARLNADAAETILRRSLLIASGTCSPSEYQRMVTEKLEACSDSWLALCGGGDAAAILGPFSRRAAANARRLRRS